MRRAWDRRPLTVKGEHLFLERFNSDISVSEVDFSTTEFWIQIHGTDEVKKMLLKLVAWWVEPWKQTLCAQDQGYGKEVLESEWRWILAAL